MSEPVVVRLRLDKDEFYTVLFALKRVAESEDWERARVLHNDLEAAYVDAPTVKD